MLKFLFGNPLKRGRALTAAIIMFPLIYFIGKHQHDRHAVLWASCASGIILLFGVLGGRS